MLPTVLHEVAEVREEKSDGRREERKLQLELPPEELQSRNAVTSTTGGYLSARESISAGASKLALLSTGYSSKGRTDESGSMLSFRRLQELQNKLVEAAESGYRGSIWARNYFHKSKSVECKVKTRSKVSKKEETSLAANCSGSVLGTGGTIDNSCPGAKMRSKEENYIQKNINNVNKHGEKLRLRTDTA